MCPDHKISLEGQSSNQICDKILELDTQIYDSCADDQRSKR